MDSSSDSAVVRTPLRTSEPDACVQAIIDKVGTHLVLGLPLGLGKPVRLANALYQRACNDTSISLHIVTALSLLPPTPASSLERRFLGPFLERLYGDQPELDYARDVVTGDLPENVTVSEFFFQAGRYLTYPEQQQNYVCTNYTHAVRDLMAQGINVIAQMVAPPQAPGGDLSLSCNPDLTLDLLPLLDQRQVEGTAVAIAAEINHYLPWLGHHAAVADTAFDLILERPEDDYPLFPVPQMAISPADHLIGFYASSLIRDGGTLQVGIGSLGAAVVHSTLMRHQQNATWKRLGEALEMSSRCPLAEAIGGREPFVKGLYGCSEMMVDGFIHLLKAGILKRRVYDDPELQAKADRGDPVPEQQGVVLHGGFYVGPASFYQQLRDLTDEERELISMTSVNYINDLYDHRFGNQALKVAQRRQARFINSAMMVTLGGGVVSDGLEDGRVISGVGGQYNFVAMAHELKDARSVIALRSTRESGGETVSNIVFSYGHCTIPRHLRDVVITEYGIADLRGKPDEVVYLALIAVADARFQPQLLEQARNAGKVSRDFRLPEDWQNNTPEAVARALAVCGDDAFPAFPFGCDFTDVERILGKALTWLKSETATRRGTLATLCRALATDPGHPDLQPFLKRMDLAGAFSPKARLDRRLVALGLLQTGAVSSSNENNH